MLIIGYRMCVRVSWWKNVRTKSAMYQREIKFKVLENMSIYDRVMNVDEAREVPGYNRLAVSCFSLPRGEKDVMCMYVCIFRIILLKI